MATLGNILPLEDDELLFSYIYRLLRENGYETTGDVYETLFQHHTKYSSTHQIRYDTFEDLTGLFNQLSNIDPIEFFLHTTIYPFLAPLLTSDQQTQIVNVIYRGKALFPGLVTSPNTFIKHLQICPKCRDEMLKKKGFFWYQRAQNLPGVTTCTKHGVKLVRFVGKTGHELDDESFAEIPSDVPSCAEYDAFAATMLKKQLDCSRKEILKVAQDHIRELGYSESYQKIEEDFKQSVFFTMFTGNPDRFFRISMHNPNKFYSADEINLTAVLGFLFGSPDKIVIKGNVGRFGELLDECGTDYDLFRPYRDTIVEMEHKDCGTRFVVTPQGFLDGWWCPKCMAKLSPQDNFRIIFKQKLGSDYELKSDFISLYDKITIHHKVCGRTYTARARSILIEGTQCTCHNEISETEAAKRLGPGLKLLKYNGMDDISVIKCEKCGSIFERQLRHFTDRHGVCPICNQKPVLTSLDIDDFKQNVKDLVGDEYTVLGSTYAAHEKIRMRHNKCGTEFFVSPSDFKMGTRCPNCRLMIHDRDFFNFVSDVSKGRYHAYKADNPKNYMVEDTWGIQKPVKRNKQTIIQELLRPTLSPILPLAEKGTYKIIRPEERLLKYLHENYTDDSLIHISEIHFENRSKKNISDDIKHLVKRTYLTKCAYGYYCFSSFHPSEWDKIERIYIKNNGHVFGFIYGNHFYYQAGLTNQAPDYFMICTNKEASEHGRIIKVCESKIRIKTLPVEITDDNWEMLQLLDLIQYSYHYGWDITAFIKIRMAQHKIKYEDMHALAYTDTQRRILERMFDNDKTSK